MIYNLLSTIKNAHVLRKQQISIPNTKLNYNICHLLVRQGFLKSLALDNQYILITFKYAWDGSPVFRSFNILSKTRVPVYFKKPTDFGERYQITVLSTNQGIYTKDECYQLGIGGKALFAIVL